MTVLYCYTKIHERALEALASDEFEIALTNTSGDEFTYWRALSRWWGFDDLIIIEHDIVVNPDTIESLYVCNEDWCVYTYPIWDNGWHTDITAALGCTKFSVNLQEQFPSLEPPVPWHHIEWITKPFWDAGVRPHVHGTVQHLHDYAGDIQTRKASQTTLVQSYTSETQPNQTP